MTRQELNYWGRSQLSECSPSAAVDARYLLCHVLGVDQTALFREPDTLVADKVVATYKSLIKRRQAGEPVAYLLGEKDFYDATFMVTADTLIPRPETEGLVDAALAHFPAKQSALVADLGTGSGIVGLTLARLRPKIDVLCTDQSHAALQVAQQNATRQQLDNVQFKQADWLTGITTQFDVIVSNPPYVAHDDAHLKSGDLRFEPVSALVAANQGLADIGRIIEQAATRLNAGGYLLFEHGYDQADEVRDLLREAGFVQVTSRRDLAGHERVTEGMWPTA